MTDEKIINKFLGDALISTNALWNKETVKIEKTKLVKESNAFQIDILITIDDMPPVAIETSFTKKDADKDARKRLGLHLLKNDDEIKTAIAIEYDEKYRNIESISPDDVFKYSLHQKISDKKENSKLYESRRFPEEGFMIGNYNDISRLISTTSVPKETMEEIAERVAILVKNAADKLNVKAIQKELGEILKNLHQGTILNRLQITCILWLNAYLVQRMLFRSNNKNIKKLKIPITSTDPNECIDAWGKIIKINWKVIYEPALHVLKNLKEMTVSQTNDALELILKAVDKIEIAKLGTEINIGAELFPKLAPDRKKSAAFYTQPQSAEFLAYLTIKKSMLNDWSNPNLFNNFCIADLTCGTGTLLRFGYRQVKLFYEQANSNNNKKKKNNSLQKERNIDKLHKTAMEKGLYGIDISPIASHLTSTSLAIYSKKPYKKTNIGWVVVGKPDKTGSIEYIDTYQTKSLFGGISGRSKGQGGKRKEEKVDELYDWISIKNRSCDVILMNPPYSRTRGGQSAFDIAGMSTSERKNVRLDGEV